MFLLSIACLLSVAASGPDSVKMLEGGKVLEGRVVFEGKDEIVLRVDRKDQRIPRHAIGEIKSLERSLAAVIENDLREEDKAKLVQLAAVCTASGLDAEARNLWLRVLLADPENEAALQGAGAKRVQKDVQVKLGKDLCKLSELKERQRSWKQAYDLDTTHFAVRSDLDLPTVLDLAVALERFHKRFYDTLGAPLELYIFDELPEVHIYGRAQDFPVPPVKTDVVWFAPGINRLNVLIEAEPSIANVVSELSKMMLFNSLRRSAGDTAQVPMWTSSGIAQVFARAAPTVRFGPWAELGEPDGAMFAAAKTANVPLARVFNASANDFNADAKRGEMQASAYSLVHFLVFGKDGELRTGYGDFLREGAKGKISLKAMCDALKVPEKDLEAAWRAHVEAHAK